MFIIINIRHQFTDYRTGSFTTDTVHPSQHSKIKKPKKIIPKNFTYKNNMINFVL